MFKSIASAAVLVSTLLLSGAAVAQEQDFTIINRTGHTVMTLNVSPHDQEEWGPDILGNEVLPDGESGDVSFSPEQDTCLWDLRVTLDNGEVGDWRGIDLCEVTTVTLNDE
ncbi:hypothetical protein [Brevundimonas sp.]|jgi:hypothetical protein|uniref:hypothetical protein n=1 Tax=Brevundimonas sp. TaxID=1871086 RepID=UPI00391CF09C|nr:hypothetical protein [Brevundimonas sp.]MCA3717783.1 hypothetical protein [Brevundimonas sp.]